MLVSLNIPFYNSFEVLNRLIYSIQNYNISKEYKYELVLIDDGSDDYRATALAMQVADVYVRHEKTLGIAQSRNDAILNSRGDFIVTMDCDIIVMPRWLDILMDIFLAHISDDAFRIFMIAPILIGELGFHIKNPHFLKNDLLDVGQVGTYCTLFERSLVGKMGMFDPELKNLWSDYDFCRRVMSKSDIFGYVPHIAITPKTCVYHHGYYDNTSHAFIPTNDSGDNTRSLSKFAEEEWDRAYYKSACIIRDRWGQSHPNIGAWEIKYGKL